ncbi:hypothetical protein PMAYCL1PPCAC_01952, partial [Pristionchus mayeri]
LKYQCQNNAACVYALLGESIFSTAVICTKDQFATPVCSPTVLPYSDSNALVVQCCCSTSECSKKVKESAKSASSSLLGEDKCVSSSPL